MTATPSPSPRRAAAAAPPPPCAAATSDRRGRGPLRQALAVAPRPPAAPSRPSPWFTPPADTVRLRGVPINRGAGDPLDHLALTLGEPSSRQGGKTALPC